ncbi:MAG: glycoside hydrolase family 25 [Lachnospiraceae bacterium]|nr:glycoside hydrolase family 25 [Lachnospiraceae bacterium]
MDKQKAKKKLIICLFIVAVGLWIFLFGVWEGIFLIKDPMKRNYPVTGIDVSHYQGNIDWEEVEEDMDITFAFIKATEGSSHIDKKFKENWKEVQKTDIYVGAYHFFSFESTGKEQAEHFINTVEKVDNMLPPVVDVEYYEGMKEKPSVNNLRAELDDMLECLEKHYGCKPIIYSTMSVYEKYLDDYYNEYSIWMRNTYIRPFLFKNRQWTFWQYSDKGEWAYGTKDERYVDKNVFAGGKEAFLRYFDLEK